LPHAEKISVASTSLAAETAAKEPNSAAICNIVCAELYGLKVLAKNIEDQKGDI
jgi:chorismate mutase/prephenate dehydratase